MLAKNTVELFLDSKSQINLSMSTVYVDIDLSAMSEYDSIPSILLCLKNVLFS